MPTLYRYDRRAELWTDRIAVAKAAYEREGPGRTNLRYGYVAPDRVTGGLGGRSVRVEGVSR